MGGSKKARKGISNVTGRGEVWGRAIEKYRVIVFGKQSSLKLRPSGGYTRDAARQGRAVDAEKTREREIKGSVLES